MKRYFLVVLLVALAYPLLSRPYKTPKKKKQIQSRAEACSPSSASIQFDINDVRTIIENGGNMWQDRSRSIGSYFIPKNLGASAIYGGSLWMGGVDFAGQLKLAAVSFRTQGDDFWAGPLKFDKSTDTFDPSQKDASLAGNRGYGEATVDASVCVKWDKFFHISKADVRSFYTYNNIKDNPKLLEATFPNGYTISQDILDWPGNGDGIDEDYYMAPYFNKGGGADYSPQDGDFPWYVLENTPSHETYINCREDRRVTLFGDETYWWIFNDRGNIHQETGGDAIGMEIRAQAFAFVTNDEVNQMTFYNYELINRSTQTLFNTYFAQWVDADIGGSTDDYVGCDVQRGLGYAYNGDNFDEDVGAAIGYRGNPPAIGVDFFEGPYQDNDGKDNIGPNEDNNFDVSTAEALADDGIVYRGIGVGYGDGVVDNERFGMRKFVYYNIGQSVNGDPQTASDYYNYMRGLWRDNTEFFYGGNAHQSGGANSSIPCDYMFPGDTDPKSFGTQGVTVDSWSEFTESNPSGDRRFMQSAGPFTLSPGQVNNITVGVVFARTNTGDATASIDLMRIADDKAQILFDNCFQVLEGPNAPTLEIVELNKELVFTLVPAGNNINEDYEEIDPIIPQQLSVVGDSAVISFTKEQRSYKFQGYQVFMLVDENVSVADLDDSERARLIFQTDIKDDIRQIINYDFDPITNTEIATEMLTRRNSAQASSTVDLSNLDDGIKHTFSIKEDVFAEGDRALINYKDYYFIVVAYAHNNYLDYDPINSPQGQRQPYISSRKNGDGSVVQAIKATPRLSSAKLGGTRIRASYGDGVSITRIEGAGNGGNPLTITDKSEQEILQYGYTSFLKYRQGNGPVDIKVVDPIGLANVDVDENQFNGSEFYLRIVPMNALVTVQGSNYIYDLNILHKYYKNFAYLLETDTGIDTIDSPVISVNTSNSNTLTDIYNASYMPTITILVDQDGDGKISKGESMDTVTYGLPWELMVKKKDSDSLEIFSISKQSILVGNEQVIPELGISIEFSDYAYDTNYVAILGQNKFFPQYILPTEQLNAQEQSEIWLNFLPDEEGGLFNWVRSGSNTQGNTPDVAGADPDGTYENLGLAPFSLVAADTIHAPASVTNDGDNFSPVVSFPYTRLYYIPSVLVVLTPDKSKWTRTPVLETQDYRPFSRYNSSVRINGSNVSEGALKLSLRRELSVDKDGNPDGSTIDGNPSYGMSWFPGYAINLETGERLNMAFGEDSWLDGHNGNDMIFNPTDASLGSGLGVTGIALGGKHYIYIYDSRKQYASTVDRDNTLGYYDGGGAIERIFRRMDEVSSLQRVLLQRAVWGACVWSGIPLLIEGKELLSSEIRFNINVSKPYALYKPSAENTSVYSNTSTSVNQGYPYYQFSLDDTKPLINQTDVYDELLTQIKVVPNPYYGYSGHYEPRRLNNRVKIINLPTRCDISIYDVNGTLIRTFRKDDGVTTEVEWDLKNHRNVPISGGVYLVHIKFPDGRETIVKWFGILRPPDLQNF